MTETARKTPDAGGDDGVGVSDYEEAVSLGVEAIQAVLGSLAAAETQADDSSAAARTPTQQTETALGVVHALEHTAALDVTDTWADVVLQASAVPSAMGRPTLPAAFPETTVVAEPECGHALVADLCPDLAAEPAPVQAVDCLFRMAWSERDVSRASLWTVCAIGGLAWWLRPTALDGRCVRGRRPELQDGQFRLHAHPHR